MNRTDVASEGSTIHLVGKVRKQIIPCEIHNYGFVLSAEKYGMPFEFVIEAIMLKLRSQG